MKVLLLDVNGPLGDIVKLWLDAAREVLSEDEFGRVVELIKKGKGKPEGFFDSLSKTESSVELLSMVKKLHTEELSERFKEKLREHFRENRVHDIINALSEHFDKIVLYTDMPEAVARDVARVLSELTGREIHHIGAAVPPYPVPFNQFKQYIEGMWGTLEGGASLWDELTKRFGKGLHVVYISDEPASRNEHIEPNLLREKGVLSFSHYGNVTLEGKGGISTGELAVKIREVRPHFRVEA